MYKSHNEKVNFFFSTPDRLTAKETHNMYKMVMLTARQVRDSGLAVHQLSIRIGGDTHREPRNHRF